MATAGGRGVSLSRRAALWAAGAFAGAGPGRLPGTLLGGVAPPLPAMDQMEEDAADLWATGVTPASHPMRHLREELSTRGVVPAGHLLGRRNGERLLVAGVVTHRQQPETAGGAVFLNLEDETGLVNVVCSVGCWARFRPQAATAPVLCVRGRLELAGGSAAVVAERLEPLRLPLPLGRSRDFR